MSLSLSDERLLREWSRRHLDFSPYQHADLFPFRAISEVVDDYCNVFHQLCHIFDRVFQRGNANSELTCDIHRLTWGFLSRQFDSVPDEALDIVIAAIQDIVKQMARPYRLPQALVDEAEENNAATVNHAKLLYAKFLFHDFTYPYKRFLTRHCVSS